MFIYNYLYLFRPAWNAKSTNWRDQVFPSFSATGKDSLKKMSGVSWSRWNTFLQRLGKILILYILLFLHEIKLHALLLMWCENERVQVTFKKQSLKETRSINKLQSYQMSYIIICTFLTHINLHSTPTK